ncbi:hypothetical protein GQ55_5G193900 [Panicum hallii var. hallii]|uniref:Uncharacterized protein n=1 Tax=Panicum hallii var. hallii TaxID=1504633 RepID=A0A2T7DHZ8_9POAL|nr:hypothetical protein GQ55_5G193900 [Panicum hallii var. hallii]
MENPIFENPIVAAAIDAFNGRVGDADAVYAVQGLLDFVRAEIGLNAARYAEVEAQLAVARRRYAEALLEATSELAPEQAVVAGGPELAAGADAYAELTDRAHRALLLHRDLRQALVFFLLLRAGAYAWTRAPLVPGVLAAAYAIAYAATGGTVAPGPASLLGIAVLVLCFLFGFLD